MIISLFLDDNADHVTVISCGLSDCCFVPRVLLLQRFANDDVFEDPAVRSKV